MLVMVAAVVTACGPRIDSQGPSSRTIEVQEPSKTVVPPKLTSSGIKVMKSGFSLEEGRFGVGAKLYNHLGNTVIDIDLRIDIYSRSHKRIGGFRDGIPFCPGHHVCWFGSTFAIKEVIDSGRAIGFVQVEVAADDGAVSTAVANLNVSELYLSRGSLGEVTGDLPNDVEGTAAIVALRGGRPIAGIMVEVGPGRGFIHQLSLPQDIFPAQGKHEILKGTLYTF